MLVYRHWSAFFVLHLLLISVYAQTTSGGDGKPQKANNLATAASIDSAQAQAARKTEFAVTPKSNEAQKITSGQPNNDKPTTLIPYLTTEGRQQKSSSISRSDSNFKAQNSTLVPAASNSRIQIKKGPNGKDYEYEYVYYYYDDEENDKSGINDGTQKPDNGDYPRNNTRNKPVYTTGENPERIISQITVSPTRVPVNEYKDDKQPSLNVNHFSNPSTYYEHSGPEFPQNLPSVPVRFVGVTPIEGAYLDPAGADLGRRTNQYSKPEIIPSEDPLLTKLLEGGKQNPNNFEQERVRYNATELQKNFVPSLDFSPGTSLHPSVINSNLPVKNPSVNSSSVMEKLAHDLYIFTLFNRSEVLNSIDQDSSEESTDSVPTNAKPLVPPNVNGFKQIPLKNRTVENIPEKSFPIKTTEAENVPTAATKLVKELPVVAKTSPAPVAAEPAKPSFSGFNRRKPGNATSFHRSKFNGPTTTEKAEAVEAPKYGSQKGTTKAPEETKTYNTRTRGRLDGKLSRTTKPATESTSPASTGYKPKSNKQSNSASRPVHAAEPAKTKNTTTPTATGLNRSTGQGKLHLLNRNRGPKPSTAAPVDKKEVIEEALATENSQESNATDVVVPGAKVPAPGGPLKHINKLPVRSNNFNKFSANLNSKLGNPLSTTTTESLEKIDESSEELVSKDESVEAHAEVGNKASDRLNGKLNGRKRLNIPQETNGGRIPGSLPQANRRINPLLRQKNSIKVGPNAEIATSSTASDDSSMTSSLKKYETTPSPKTTETTGAINFKSNKTRRKNIIASLRQRKDGI